MSSHLDDRQSSSLLSSSRTLNPIITPPAVEAVETIQESSPVSPLSPSYLENSGLYEHIHHQQTPQTNNMLVRHQSPEPIDVLSPKLMSQALNFKDSVDFVLPEDEEESKVDQK